MSPTVFLPWRKTAGNVFGLDSDVFYFMFSFDYYSFPERKNPLAVVRAFVTAFRSSTDPSDS